MSTDSTVSPPLTKPLRVWERIELQVGEGEQAGQYRARVLDFINGGIVITDPEFITGSSLLRENAGITVIIRRDDAMYQFASSIKKTMGTTGRQFILTPPRRCERVQRRMFVRVDVQKKLKYARIVPLGDWPSYDDHLSWHQTLTQDMSAGGLSFKVYDEIPSGSLLLLIVEYESELPIPEAIVSVVRRCFFKGGSWHCGAQFVLASALTDYLEQREIEALPPAVTHFNRNAQNRLASSVFAMQVEMRKKGLL